MVCLKKTLSCVTSWQLCPHPWSFADPELHLPLFLPGSVDQILFIKAPVSSHVSDHIFIMARQESDPCRRVYKLVLWPSQNMCPREAISGWCLGWSKIKFKIENLILYDLLRTCLLKELTLFFRLVIKLIFVCGFDLCLVVTGQYFHDCAIIINSGLDGMRINMISVPFSWPLVFKALVFLDDSRMVMLKKKVCGWVAVLPFCCLSAHPPHLSWQKDQSLHCTMLNQARSLVYQFRCPEHHHLSHFTVCVCRLFEFVIIKICFIMGKIPSRWFCVKKFTEGNIWSIFIES